MKKFAKKVLVLMTVCLIISMSSTYAQTEPTTKIAYKVESGTNSQIKAQSVEMTGKLALDETGDDISGISLYVPLSSFKGSRGNFLEKLGDSDEDSELYFISNSIREKGNTVEIMGELEFNKKFQPVTVKLRRQDVDGKIVLTGNFDLDTSKYFIGDSPSDLDVDKIPFKFTLVFNEPDVISRGLTLSTDR